MRLCTSPAEGTHQSRRWKLQAGAELSTGMFPGMSSLAEQPQPQGSPRNPAVMLSHCSERGSGLSPNLPEWKTLSTSRTQQRSWSPGEAGGAGCPQSVPAAPALPTSESCPPSQSPSPSHPTWLGFFKAPEEELLSLQKLQRALN